MTNGVARRLTLLWMLATVAHLPVPMWEGASVGVSHAESPLIRLGEFFDFVRLGCCISHELESFPDGDEQDSPGESQGMFPAYLAVRSDSLLAGRSPAAGAVRWREIASPIIDPSRHEVRWAAVPIGDRPIDTGALEVMRC